jgi:hypothetical protein
VRRQKTKGKFQSLILQVVNEREKEKEDSANENDRTKEELNLWKHKYAIIQTMYWSNYIFILFYVEFIYFYGYFYFV